MKRATSRFVQSERLGGAFHSSAVSGFNRAETRKHCPRRRRTPPRPFRDWLLRPRVFADWGSGPPPGIVQASAARAITRDPAENVIDGLRQLLRPTRGPLQPQLPVGWWRMRLKDPRMMRNVERG